MKMALDIEIFGAEENEASDLAAELKQSLKADAEVKLSSKPYPPMATRGPGLDAIIPVINIVFVAAQTAILLATLLKKSDKKSIGSTFIITNPETGEKERILETDSLKQVQKKISKILGKKRT